MYDVVIIGTGVTGYAAAMYAARLDLSVLVIGDLDGGTIMLTDDVSNYPGFSKITGKDLADNIMKHAFSYSMDQETERVIDALRDPDGFFKLITAKQEYLTKSIIFATGTKLRKLDVPGYEEFDKPIKGISHCALCDYLGYKGKVAGVVGGSDSAVTEAIFLVDHCSKVYIIYRGNKLRAEPVTLRRIESELKIEVITNTNIVEVLGDERVTRVRLDNPYNGSDMLELHGIFVAIGGVPESDIAKKLGVKLNEKGEIKIDRSGRTNVLGIFAAGDVVDSDFKQAITGTAEGVLAAYQAYRYVNENEFVLTCQDDVDSL